VSFRRPHGGEICQALTRRVDRPNSVRYAAKVVGQGLCLGCHNDHNSAASNSVNNRHKIAVARNQDSNLKKSIEGADKHIYCYQPVNSLLAPPPASKGAKSRFGVGQQLDGSPVFLHLWVNNFVGACVVKEDTRQANRGVRGPRALFRVHHTLGRPPVLNQFGVGDVACKGPGICEGAAVLFADPEKIPSVNEAVRVHEFKYSAQAPGDKRPTRSLQRTPDGTAESRPR
jgi:hypothetical protein